MHNYAQTNIQLLNQLQREGYSVNDLKLVRDAYAFVQEMDSVRFRASGKTFIAHLVGTASILGSLHVPIEVVTAGLLHTAYMSGHYRSLLCRVKAQRKRIQRSLGRQIDKCIARYTALHWSAEVMAEVHGRIKDMDVTDRYVLLIRLVNEMEDSLDCGILYWQAADKRKQQVNRDAQMMVQLAEVLGQPALASAMTETFQDAAAAKIHPELRQRRKRRGLFVRALRRLRIFW